MEKFFTKKNIIISACVLLALVIAVVTIVLIAGSAKREGSSSTDNKGEQGSYQSQTDKQRLGDVIIPVKLSGSEKICAGQYFFEYDSKALEYVTYENGDLFDECDVNLTKEGKLQCVITNSDLEDVRARGTLLTFVFKQKEEGNGKYTVKVGEQTNMCNSNGKLKTPKIKPEKVRAK